MAELPRLLNRGRSCWTGDRGDGRYRRHRLRPAPATIGLTNPADAERIRRRIPVAYLIFDVRELRRVET